MLFLPNLVVIRRLAVALVLSVFVGFTAIAPTTPAWAAPYDVTATITVGTDPWGVAFSPDGTKAYVTNRSTNDVRVIDTSTSTVTATITVGDLPLGVAVSPDGTKAYVASFISENVSVIDTSTNTVTATITVGLRPWDVAVSPDGNKAYVTNSNSSTVSVIDTPQTLSRPASRWGPVPKVWLSHLMEPGLTSPQLVPSR